MVSGARVNGASLLERPAVAMGRRPAGLVAGWLAEWDLVILVAVILADIRLFQGSSVSSFTLFEIVTWLYCCPVVIGRLAGTGPWYPPVYAGFLRPLAAYVAWILFASVTAIATRGDSAVLQSAKNIVPVLPLVGFLFIRIRRTGTVAKIANLYVLYCLATAVIGIVQFRLDGPYLRAPIENNEFKVDLAGDLVTNLVLGFSATPNELAVIILPGLMFCAMKLVDEIRVDRFPRLVTLACCGLCGTVFVLAQSRGAMAWFALGFAFMVAPTARSRSFLLKLGLVCGMIALLVGIGLHATPSAEIDNTVQVRYLLWQTALEAMTHDLYVALLGDGSKYVALWSSQEAGWEFPDSHNGWIDQALFFGVPAFLLYLAIWRRFFAICDAAPTRFMSRHERLLLDSLRASLLALMGLTFFEPVADAPYAIGMVFLLMACGVVMAQLAGRAAVVRRCG